MQGGGQNENVGGCVVCGGVVRGGVVCGGVVCGGVVARDGDGDGDGFGEGDFDGFGDGFGVDDVLGDGDSDGDAENDGDGTVTNVIGSVVPAGERYATTCTAMAPTSRTRPTAFSEAVSRRSPNQTTSAPATPIKSPTTLPISGQSVPRARAAVRASLAVRASRPHPYRGRSTPSAQVERGAEAPAGSSRISVGWPPNPATEEPRSMRAKTIHDNPSADELRAFTERMPTARITEFGNVNVQTKVTSRSAGSTFIATDDPSITDGKTVSREEYARLAKLQDDHIAEREMAVVDGYIGNVPDFRTRARLSIEVANANIAGMQQKLYYDSGSNGGGAGGDPEVQVIYTPNLLVPGYPDDRCIAVDLDAGVTRVMGSDYFGESKKGGLRMWNTIVYGARRPGAARRAEGDPRERRREGVPDHRALGHGQDHDDVHHAERLAARPGRLRRADARRARLRE